MAIASLRNNNRSTEKSTFNKNITIESTETLSLLTVNKEDVKISLSEDFKHSLTLLKDPCAINNYNASFQTCEVTLTVSV